MLVIHVLNIHIAHYSTTLDIFVNAAVRKSYHIIIQIDIAKR